MNRVLLLLCFICCCLCSNHVASTTTTTLQQDSSQHRHHQLEEEQQQPRDDDDHHRSSSSSSSSNATVAAAAAAAATDSTGAVTDSTTDSNTDTGATPVNDTLVVAMASEQDIADSTSTTQAKKESLDSIASTTTTSSSSTGSTRSSSENHAVEILHLQKNLDACLTQSQQQAIQLSSELVQTSGLREQLSALESNMALVRSNYETLLQSLKDCKNEKEMLQENHRESIETLHSTVENYDAKVSRLEKEKESLQDQIQSLETKYKQRNMEYYNARQDVHGLEKELREMYDKSQSTYVNMTLIVQDVGWVLVKTCDDIVQVLEDWYHSKPVTDFRKRVYSVICTVWRKCWNVYQVYCGEQGEGEHYRVDLLERLKHVHEQVHEYVTVHVHGHVVQGVEQIQRKLVFMVEHGSRIVLSYMDMTDGAGGGGGDNAGGGSGKWYAASLDAKAQRRSKIRPRLNRLVRNGLQYTEKNAEQVVSYGCMGGMLGILVTAIMVVMYGIVSWLWYLLRGAGRLKKSTTSEKGKRVSFGNHQHHHHHSKNKRRVVKKNKAE